MRKLVLQIVDVEDTEARESGMTARLDGSFGANRLPGRILATNLGHSTDNSEV